MNDKDWVTHALTDISLVADLLIRMRSATTNSPLLPLDWNVRQRRSRSVTKHVAPSTPAAASLVTESNNKTKTGGIGSPSTPLSWSGATSGGSSGGVTCREESSKVTLKELFVNSGSKVPITCENTTTPTTKRSRKKKTLAELKEEESLLLNEKRKLKSELAIMRFTFEKQRATNESLKRVKLDLQTQKSGQLVDSFKEAKKACSDQTQQKYIACAPSNVLPTGVAFNVCDDVPQIFPANTRSEVQDIGSNRAEVMLPDLNMPVGEDTSSDILCEVN